MNKLTTDQALSEVFQSEALTEYAIDYAQLKELFGEPTFTDTCTNAIVFSYVFKYKNGYFDLIAWDATLHEAMQPGFVWDVLGSNKRLLKGFIKQLDLRKELIAKREECYTLAKMVENHIYNDKEKAVFKKQWVKEILKYNEIKSKLEGYE